MKGPRKKGLPLPPGSSGKRTEGKKTSVNVLSFPVRQAPPCSVGAGPSSTAGAASTPQQGHLEAEVVKKE